MQTAISALGLLVMIFLAWLMSSNRRQLNWRIIFGGLALQIAFALFILRTTPGRLMFDGIGDLFEALNANVEAGSSFLFGLNPRSDDELLPPTYALLRSFAFGVLPTIIFFSSLMSILYHLGIMQRLVNLIAWIMQKTLGTSGAESLSAASNIFVGQTEAPLVIRPYISKMTTSELNAVMVGGFATIAGGVMAAFVEMGVDAGHLVTASVISAPAALLIAKVMLPETGQPETLGPVKNPSATEHINLIEAAAAGASDGLKLALNVGAMLIAFLALLAMANSLVGWVGEQFYDLTSYLFRLPRGATWSLELFFGYAFAPFAWIMGIPTEDCRKAGELLGVKMVANEFLAYDGLGKWAKETGEAAPNPRSIVIMTYALSGFANFSSIGIQLGGIGGIAPERRADLARLGLRAMFGGTLAAFMTACIAGILLPSIPAPVEKRPIEQPNAVSTSTSFVKIKTIRQQAVQCGFDKVSRLGNVNQQNSQIRNEFRNDLPTSPTRSMTALGGYCKNREFTLTKRNGILHRHPLCTYRQAKRPILHVAARVQHPLLIK